MRKLIVFVLTALMFLAVSATTDARYRTCPNCDGKGVVDATVWSYEYNRAIDVEVECPDCEGTGEVKVRDN